MNPRMALSLIALVCLPGLGSSLPFQGGLQSQSLVSSERELPFWLWVGTLGEIQEQARAHQVGTAWLAGERALEGTASRQLFYGFRASGELTSGTDRGQLTELYMGLRTPKWVFLAGQQAQPESYAGLSSTNGDLFASNHARPRPRVSLGTHGYRPLFGDFSWRGVYEESYLGGDDDNAVSGAMLHHKNLYVKLDQGTGLTVSAGLDHYVWWGGRLADGTRMPSGLRDYLCYVFAKNGDVDFPKTEERNSAGNALGQYRFEVTQALAFGSLQAYLCHPFEDGSGLKWQNYRDNFVGLWLHRDAEAALVRDVVVEYYAMMDQNGSRAKDGKYAQDDYMNHGLYTSGYTYDGRVLGSPLFYPVVSVDGTVTGIANNRFRAVHLGVGGRLAPAVDYRVLATWSRNRGTYAHPYPGAADRLNLAAFVAWRPGLGPLRIEGGVGHDRNEVPEEGRLVRRSSTALSLSLTRTF